MMMCSFRFPRKLRLSLALVLAVAVVLGAGRLVVGLMPARGAAVSAGIPKGSGKQEVQRQEFLAQLGWKIDSEPCEIADVVIPKQFDEVYENYNAIQKEQGMGLERYGGKRCTRYSYSVKNHPSGAKNVRVNLLVCGGKIIGGDVCSLGLDGFMHGLAFPEEKPPERGTSAAPAPKASK